MKDYIKWRMANFKSDGEKTLKEADKSFEKLRKKLNSYFNE